MAEPSVCVALCTFQGEEFIAEQLRSIASQDTAVDYVVIGDDGSTDATLDIVASVAAESGLVVKILGGERGLGIAGNFERTLKACDADIILLSDQDDVWFPTRVTETIKYFSENPQVEAVHSNAELIDSDGQSLGLTLFAALRISPRYVSEVRSRRSLDPLLKRNLVTGATTAVKKTLLEKALPIPTAWIHDEWLAMAASIGEGLGVIDSPLIAYRQHGGNAIGVSKLSLSQAASRLREDGLARNERLLTRAQQLADYVASRSSRLDASVTRKVSGKLRHEQFRSQLSQSRVKRVLPVVIQLSIGNYGRYGNGIADAIRDVVQPLRMSARD